MKPNKRLILSLLAGLCLLAGPLAAAKVSICGHISFVDKGAAVIRADGSEDTAVVNLPVIPGDTVVTAAGGRCELQFDNGTVIRLDKDTRLRLATVLAPSLTSNWMITTLELEKGQMYALPQSYRSEMFQIVTPNAAASLKSRVRAYIRLDRDGGTSFFSDGGKFQLLYGPDSRSLKKATVKSDRPLAITAANVQAERVEKRDIEFMGWNEYVDNHFKEMHYGISKLPPKLRFGNTALTYWAEKWSSMFGEWIYDELFGYVWRPADERFALSARPFFHADLARINGELFLIPQQAWGWVPAHMGTWVWMKRGWTWIPGDWFHNGVVDNHGSFMFPTFGYYWNVYGSPSLWSGRGSNGDDHPIRFPKKPVPPVLPDPVIKLVKRVIKAPDGDGSKRLAVGKEGATFDGFKLPPAPVPVPRVQRPAANAVIPSVTLPAQKRENAAGEPDRVALKRDWNPDSRWAGRSGFSIRYSSSRNAVICPELKVSSDNMQGVARMWFREGASRQHRDSSSGSRSYEPQGNSSSGSANDGTATSNQGNSGSGTGEKKGR